VSTDLKAAVSKVTEVKLIFWVIKIAATMFGETAGDAVAKSMQLGYVAGTEIFAAICMAAI